MKRPYSEAFEIEGEDEYDEGYTLDWITHYTRQLTSATTAAILSSLKAIFARAFHWWQVQHEVASVKRQKTQHSTSPQGPGHQFLPPQTEPKSRLRHNPMAGKAKDVDLDLPKQPEMKEVSAKNMLKTATMNNTPKPVKSSGGLFTPVNSGSPMQVDKMTPWVKNTLNFSPDVTPGYNKGNRVVPNRTYGTSFVFNGESKENQYPSPNANAGAKTKGSWVDSLRNSYRRNATMTTGPRTSNVTAISLDMKRRTPFAQLSRRTSTFQDIQRDRERLEREREHEARMKSKQWEKQFPTAVDLKQRRKLYDEIVAKRKQIQKGIDELKAERTGAKAKDTPFKPLPAGKVQEVEGLWRERSNRVVVTGFKIDITIKDLLTLRDREWLNDNIIDYYLSMVTQRDGSFCFSTHFYTTLESKGYKSVARWAKKKQIDVTKTDYIFVPINRSNTHWCLAVINNKDNKFQFFDSMGGRGYEALELLREYMISETDRLIPGNVEEHTQKYEGYQICDKLACPQQSNGSDCGVFTCKMAEVLSRERDFGFSQKDMPQIRRKMVYEILHKNIE